MYEEPELVAALLEKVAEVYFAYTRLLCQFEGIGAIWGTDDMGYKTQTLVAPEWLRAHVLPLHKKAAAIAHEHGKLYFLHSCGKIDALTDDLIEDVGIDAKHSFEDAATPVEEFGRRWGARVGVIGGIDVDFLARATGEQVRRRTRATLEALHPGGGYVLGTGNSVTDYVPLENYLAMVDEGRRFGG
jgi:uroporphyrinogen decarboxylase